MTGIERLRGMADAFAHHVWGAGVAEELAAVAYQIESEQEERVTRRVEDREAAEWVREHGGLDTVKERWHDRVARAHVEHMAERQRERRERMQRHIEHIQRLCRERRERIKELNRAIAEMRPRLMPEGMEWLVEAWPKFEDDAPVHVGDEINWRDEGGVVNSIELQDGGYFILHAADGAEDWIHPQYFPGERVKRPAPKVLDADGAEVEVGDDLYSVEGMLKFHVSAVDKKGGRIATEAMFALDKWADPKMYTHQRPVLGADGNRIEPAMDVWWVCEGDERGVHAERLRVEAIGLNGLVECSPYNGGTWVYLEPSELYVHKPVLGADGVPIKKGKTVWHEDGTELRVAGFKGWEDGEAIVAVNYVDGPTVWSEVRSLSLTHTKPEPLDSWERWREEWQWPPVKYCKLILGVEYDHDTQLNEAFDAQGDDLVRRAKALAERGQ